MNLHLAAAESYPNFTKESKYPNIFSSFYTTKSCGKLINIMDGKRNLIVDSGAHSFFSQRLDHAASVVRGKVDKRTSVENVDVYVDEYCEFMKVFKDKVAYFVELDIDRVVGVKKVLEIRKKLAKACGAEKLLVCYHPTMGSWEECKKDLYTYDYIGLQGIATDGKVQVDYATIVKDCYFSGKKVHAFAMTKKPFLEKVPVYSTDSSSWQAIFRFGKSAIKPKKGVLGDFYRHQMRRSYFENKHNALEEIKNWVALQKYITDLWLSRGVDWTTKVKDIKI